MRIILTGSTGYIGNGVLTRCIAHPSITSIIALTRRPLDVADPKLNNVIHKDYLKYDKDVVDQMQGAEACIWVLGSPTSGKEVHQSYTKAAIDILIASVVPQLDTSKTFRFVYTSGAVVPYLNSPALFFLGKDRKVRPDMDEAVLALEQQNPGRWESYVMRPAAVVDKEPVWSYVSSSWIFKEELAAAMVEAAVEGDSKRVLANAELRSKGQSALKMQPN